MEVISICVEAPHMIQSDALQKNLDFHFADLKQTSPASFIAGIDVRRRMRANSLIFQ